MKKIVLFLVLLITHTTLFAVTISFSEPNNPPQTFIDNHITYVAISPTEASVVGNSITTQPNISIPSTVTNGGTTYSVTSIGDNAFYQASLIGITLPNNLTSIGDYAFAYCASLQSITIPNSVTSIGDVAFQGCSSLTSITIPDSVISLGLGTFSDSGLTSITLSNSITSIEQYEFYGCSGLQSIIIPNSVTNIGDYAFQNCSSLTSIDLQNSITSIGYSTFVSCTSLTSIIIPASVTSILDNAFYNCTSLTSFTINAVTPPVISTNVFDNVTVGSVKLYVPAGSLTDYRNASVWSGFNFPPIITGPGPSTATTSSLSMNENSVAVTTFTADETVTWSLGASNDETLFSIDSSGVLVFNAAPDYESTLHSNTYIVQVIATAINSVTTSQQLTITITDVLFEPISTTIDTITYTTTSATEASVTGNTIITPSVITIPSTITIEGITYSVTSIGDNAFYGCTNLTSISLPNTVTSIGYAAFGDCLLLTEITIPVLTSLDVYAFSNCPNLTSISLPNSLTSINEGVFEACTGLTSITLLGNVTSIADYAFEDCTGLTSFTINAVTPPTITADVFFGITVGSVNLYVPSGSKAAYKSASVWSGFNFPPIITGPGPSTATTSSLSMNENSVAVTTFTADEDVIWSLGASNDGALFSIDGSGALVFNAAPDYESPSSALQSNTYIVEVIATGTNSIATSQQLTITITDVVESFTIDDITYTTSGASEVRVTGNTISTPSSKIIPSTVSDGVRTFNVTSIGDNAFNNCLNLTSITLSIGLKSIGNSGFNECRNLTNISISSTVLSIGSSAFANCENLTSVNIPSGITSISNSLFHNCYNLHIVTLPNSVTSIGISAFEHCGLTSISLSDSITSIGGNAFWACSGLSSITIPDSLTNIESNAFGHCYGFTSFRINAVTPPVILSTVFNDVTVGSVNLYVPTGSKTAYKNASVWSGFKISAYITGPGPSTGSTSSLSMSENSTAVTTFTADETVTWSLGNSYDSALFSIDSSSGVLVFNAAPDYESPSGNSQNNTYIVEVIATDTNSVTSSQQLTITVTDAVETLDNFISSVTHSLQNSTLIVTMSRPVFNTNTGSGALEASDFELLLTGGNATLLSSTPSSISANGNVYTLGITLSGEISGQETITVKPIANSIYDSSFNDAAPNQQNNSITLNFLDADADGVSNFLDQCPNSLPGVRVYPTNGCEDTNYPFITYYNHGTTLNDPYYLTATTDHTLYFVDYDSNSNIYTLKKLSPEKVLSTVITGTANMYFSNLEAGTSNNLFFIKTSYSPTYSQEVITIASDGSTSVVYSPNTINHEYINDLKADASNNLFIYKVSYNPFKNEIIKKMASDGSTSVIYSNTTSNINSLVLDNSGNLYYVINDNNISEIHKITPDGSTSVLLSTTNSYLYYLKVDNLGTIYYFQSDYTTSTENIKKITANGTLSQLYTLSNNSYIEDIALDAMNNFYFATNNSLTNQKIISIISPEGTIVSYSDYTGNSLNNDRSGTLYFNDYVSHKIMTSKLVQTLPQAVLSNFNSFTLSAGTSDFTINPPTSDSSGAITYTSSNPAVATIIGTTVHLVGPGTTTITATQAADGSHSGNSISATMNVSALCGDWGYPLTYPPTTITIIPN